MDVERGFEPKYVTIKGKTKTLSELKKAAKTASTIYLATDPDREGEAIAWHVADQINSQVPVHRVLFEEITKDAVLAAMDAPEEDRRAQGRRPAGAPDPRPAGRLQGQPDPLAHHQDRPLGRPGADRGAPAAGRAGARDPRLQAAGVLDHRGALRGQGTDLRGLAGQGGRPQAAAPQRGRSARRWWTRSATSRSWSPRSSSAAATSARPRRSPPAPCSRRRPRSSASPPGAPCAPRRISTKASTSARRARSAWSPTCAPTPSGWPRRRSHRRAS